MDSLAYISRKCVKYQLLFVYQKAGQKIFPEKGVFSEGCMANYL